MQCIYSSQCRQRLAAGADRCSNDYCAAAVLSYSSSVVQPTRLIEASYDIRVTLADHTASISRCVIAGPVAENMLGLTVLLTYFSLNHSTVGALVLSISSIYSFIHSYPFISVY